VNTAPPTITGTSAQVDQVLTASDGTWSNTPTSFTYAWMRCNAGVYSRHWVPVARFRGHGQYTVTLRARDKSGLTSLPAHRTFRR
jgi:hypothetical protein